MAEKMTRAKIREKYHIVKLERSEIANRILSKQEAKEYEAYIKMLADNFQRYWEDDNSGDIDQREGDQIYDICKCKEIT